MFRDITLKKLNTLLENGRYHFKNKNYAEAIKFFQEVLANDPQNYHANFYLADVLYEDGSSPDAERRLTTIIKTESSRLISALKKKGDIAKVHEDYSEAIKYYDQIIKLQEYVSDITLINVWYGKTELLEILAENLLFREDKKGSIEKSKECITYCKKVIDIELTYKNVKQREKLEPRIEEIKSESKGRLSRIKRKLQK